MKNLVAQFTITVVAVIALTFIMGYTRPAAEEPKEYTVIYRNYTNSDKFAEDVKTKLAEGWKPQGGVVFLNGSCFAQAMVR